MLKSCTELGLVGDVSHLGDPYTDCEASQDLWDIFVDSIRNLGFDLAITFSYSLGRERLNQITNNKKFPWIVGTARNHVYVSTEPYSHYQKFMDRDVFNDNPFIYHLANCRKTAILGYDFLDINMPNYGYAKRYWDLCVELGFRNALCVPYEGLNPLTQHGFSLHCSLHGPEFEKMIKEVGRDVLLNCHRFAQRFYLIFPQEIASDLGFTKKQYHSFRLFDQGFSNDEIADTMGVTSAAVSLHLKEVRKKLDVTTNREISAKARRLCLVS
jgi:DNA-binding CsgD family transcriptional regulator